MMKKHLFVLVMALVLLFALGSTAMAKYAGYAYNSVLPTGTMVFDPITEEWAASTTSVPNDQPGYLSWTGAKALMGANGITDATILSTPHGGYLSNTSKCAVCHSVHRAASDAVAAGVGSYWKLTPGAQSCIACHTPHGATPVTSALIEWADPYSDGGPHRSFNCLGACHASVHGANTSQYGAVSMWNLTTANDAAITAALAAGNDYTLADTVANDAVNRTRGVVTAETMDNDFTGLSVVQGSTTKRAIRAMATGYTCGASGCHSSSQFAVNVKGYGELRAGDPSNSTTLDTVMTGHVTNMTYGCPPCHMNQTVFYNFNNDTLAVDSGCALCHDALGKATASTAFPHANRNITFLETTDGMWYDDKVVGADSGNLWMYKGDRTERNAAGEPWKTGDGTRYWDDSRLLVENATGYDADTESIGNIPDGVCLKCHAYGRGTTHDSGVPYTKADGTSTGNVLGFFKF